MGIGAASLCLGIAALMVCWKVTEGFHDELEEFDQSLASPLEAFIFNRTSDNESCKTKKSCSKRGGRCVVDGTCQTIGITAKCGKNDGSNTCKCCAKAIKKRCTPCSSCIDEGGFCVMNKKACAQGTLRKGQCKCKSKKGRRRRGYCCVPPVTSPRWGYKNDSYGPDNWSKLFPKCAGNNQSPIDIQGSPFTDLHILDDPWEFTGYDVPVTPNKITVRNNGHYVTVAWNEAALASVKGGFLGAEYILHELHLHWGENYGEHLIYPGYQLELQFVHYKAEYGNFDMAMEHSDGLAIMATVYHVISNDDDHTGLMPITDALSSIVEPNSETTTTFPYALGSLIGIHDLPIYRENFYRYYGSLTSPPCSEVVIWTVFMQASGYSLDQLNAFRSLKFEDGTPMIYNNRPIQPLNSRELNRVGRYNK